MIWKIFVCLKKNIQCFFRNKKNIENRKIVIQPLATIQSPMKTVLPLRRIIFDVAVVGKNSQSEITISLFFAGKETFTKINRIYVEQKILIIPFERNYFHQFVPLFYLEAFLR